MPDVLAEADDTALETVLRDTDRGRAFPAEHARRNRAAETRLRLRAIERPEGIARENRADKGIERGPGAETHAPVEAWGEAPEGSSAAPDEPGPNMAEIRPAAKADSAPPASGARPEATHLDASHRDAPAPDEIPTVFG